MVKSITLCIIRVYVWEKIKRNYLKRNKKMKLQKKKEKTF